MAEASGASGRESSMWDRRILANNHLRVEILPALGGKLSSLSLAGSGGELLQAPLKPYAARTATEPFDSADGSGWDECLPSIGPCEIAYGDNSASVQDHGDFWRIPFTIDQCDGTRLSMHAEGTSLPLRFTRALRLEGPVLYLDYAVENTASLPVPYGWSTHPLFAVEPYDRIHLPASVRQITAAASANGRLGRAGSTHSWPHTVNALDGEPLDLSLGGSIEDGVGDKLILASPPEGWAALERKTLRTLLTLRFDPAALPFLGLWICYGGWPNDPHAQKGYTVALEPCNLPIDSLAASLAQGAGAELAPGEQQHWKLQLEVSPAPER